MSNSEYWKDKAEDFVSKYVVLSENCDIEYEEVVSALIILLKKQDRDTRHACAAAVVGSEAHNICMNIDVTEGVLIMYEQKIKDVLIDSGCEVYTYEGQDGTFLRKKFPLKTLCEKLNLNVSEVDYTMDSLGGVTEDEYVVEFIVATGEIQYYINQYHWECVGIESKLGKKLVSLMIENL